MNEWTSSNSAREARPPSEPHPDCESNYQKWRNLFTPTFHSEASSNLSKNLMKLECKVVEFFRHGGKEVKHVVFKPKFKCLNGEELPPFQDTQDVFNVYPGAIPLCVQISFADKRGKHCANINFQQSFPGFKNEMSFYLRADV